MLGLPDLKDSLDRRVSQAETDCQDCLDPLDLLLRCLSSPSLPSSLM